MAVDLKKWEAARAKRGSSAAPVNAAPTLDSFFPTKKLIGDISARRVAAAPVEPQAKPQTKAEAASIIERDKARGTTISAGPEKIQTPLGLAVSKLPRGLAEPIQDFGEGARRMFVPTRSEQVTRAFEEDPTRSDSQLTKRANELDTASGILVAEGQDPYKESVRTNVGGVDGGLSGSIKNVISKLAKETSKSLIRKTLKEAAGDINLRPAQIDELIERLAKTSDEAEVSRLLRTTTPDTGSIRDAVVRRLEEPVPVNRSGFKQADILEGGQVGTRVDEVVANLKKTPEPTVTQLNEAVEALRLSGRQVDDIVEELNTYTRSLPETYTQRAGAMDIKPLSKTKREALEVFPEKQTPEGLVELESRGRGKVSWAEAKKAAQQLGWTEEKMVNFPKGRAFSDTELMASRGISKNADDTLSAMEARLLTLEKGTPEYLKQSQEVSLQRIKAFKLKTVVVGASTEAGRALGSLRSSVEAIDMWERKVAKVFNDPKTPDYLKEYIEKTISEFTGTPQEFAKLLRKTTKTSILDMAVEFATAIKLTGIPTHVVNLVTGTTMVAMRPIERALSAAINKGETLITGAKQQRFFKDAVNDVIGQTTGWRQGGREALNAILDEDYAWNSRPLEDISVQGPAIKGRPGKNEAVDVILNVAGKVIRLPYRLLGAQDLLIREPAKMGEFYTAIGRMAIDKGYAPGSQEYADFFAATLNSPSADMVEQITKAADRVTFQDELSPGLAKLQQLISNEAKAVRFIVPFFKTIVNLQKRALEYGPLAPILPSVRGSLKASPEVRADALARMAVGTAVITPLVFEALNGNIVLESPKNPAERDAFFASGKQAYSIKIGDRWVPFNRLSPFSEWFVTAGLLGKAIENEDEQSVGELTTNTFFGLAANLFDKSFATGMADLLDALRGSEKERENWFNNFVVGSTLPVLSGNIARTVDPTLREVNGLREAYMARMPGLSDNLPARNDVFGQPITRGGSAIERAISPVIPTPAIENVVRAELESLGVTMGFPTKSTGGFEMTDEQYYDYQQIAGRATYSTLFKLISNPQFQGLPAGRREEAVNKVINEVRTTVRTQVAAEQVIMKEIQDRLEKGGLTTEQAKEKAVDVYQQLKQGNQPAQ